MARSLIEAEYQGFAIAFTESGWFNATRAAERFGKEPYEWLRLPETERYIDALCRRLSVGKSAFVKTKRGGDTRTIPGKSRNAGTWLHPKLAVVFARWLDVDFAIWADEQIDALIRGEHPHHEWKQARSEAASASKVMSEVLRLVRLGDGKATEPRHYMSEAKLLNWALSGEFKGLDRDSLALDELALLASLEERNAVLLGRGVGYPERKGMLEQHAIDWRAEHGQEKAAIQAPRHAGSLKRKSPAPVATRAGFQNQTDAGRIVAENIGGGVA